MGTVDFTKIFAKADQAVKKKNFPAAAAWYAEILNMDPDNFDAAKKLRAVQVHRCREEGKNPAGGGFSSRFASLTTKFLKKKNIEEQIQEYEKLLDKAPHNVNNLLEIGAKCQEAGFLKRARVNFETAIDVEPENVKALKALGRVFWEQKEPQSALKIFDRAKEFAPNDGELMRWIKDLAATQTTMSLESRGDDFRNKLKSAGAAAEAERRGQVLRTKDDVQRAIDAKMKDISEQPQNGKLYRELGKLYEKGKDYKKAEESYNKSRELDPRDNFTIDCFQDLQLKKFDLKIAQLQDKYRETLDESFPELINKTKKSKLIFKVKDWNRRVMAHPTDMRLRLEFGKLLMNVGKTAEAVDQFQKCLGDPKTALNANWLLGKAYTRRKLYVPAISALNKALAGCQTKNTQWKEIKYDLGTLYIEFEKEDDAKKTFAELIEVDFKFKDAAKIYRKLTGVDEAKGAPAPHSPDVELDLDINEDDIVDFDDI